MSPVPGLHALQGALHNLDGALHPRAEPPRLSQNDLRETHRRERYYRRRRTRLTSVSTRPFAAGLEVALEEAEAGALQIRQEEIGGVVAGGEEVGGGTTEGAPQAQGVGYGWLARNR
jgi:hypothetical protein